MMHRSRILLIPMLALVIAGLPRVAPAQLHWNLSVKFILNTNGSLPAFGNIINPQILSNYVADHNQLLRESGRGYQLRLADVAQLAGVSQWYDYNYAEANKNTFEAAAQANANYRWRNDAINIYICGTAGTNSGGICSFPSTGDDVILVAQNSFSDIILHEIGHYFNLLHPHADETYSNTDGSACAAQDCGCAVFQPSEGDEIADTLPDHQCFGPEQIAQSAYGQPYAALNAAQRQRVDNTWLNIMSYHSPGSVLTDDQLDRITAASNGPRFGVASGRTWFVRRPGSGLSTLAAGIQAAQDGDIVLLRAGTYDESANYSKPVTLRATRGMVTIGEP